MVVRGERVRVSVAALGLAAADVAARRAESEARGAPALLTPVGTRLGGRVGSMGTGLIHRHVERILRWAYSGP